MMKVAAVIGFVLASSVACCAHQLHADDAAFEGRGRVVLKGTAREPADARDCRKLQKKSEKADKENGPMPPCQKGSEYCDLPEFFCDQRDPDPKKRHAELRRTCTVSPTNKMASPTSCGRNRCRDDPRCFCGGVSNECLRKTCVDLQREECPNSLVHGKCSDSRNTCRIGGFRCDLRVGAEEETFCSSNGRNQGPATDDGKNQGPTDKIIKPMPSGGIAVGAPLPLAAVVGSAVMIAAMN